MTDEQREELKRLQIASLRQVGHVLRELRDIRKDTAQHFRDDAAYQIKALELQNKAISRTEKLESDVGWMKRVGAFVITALGLQHWYK